MNVSKLKSFYSWSQFFKTSEEMWTPAPDLVLCLLVASEVLGTSNYVSHLELEGPATLRAFELSLYKNSEPGHLTKPPWGPPTFSFLVYDFWWLVLAVTHSFLPDFMPKKKFVILHGISLSQGYLVYLSWSISILQWCSETKILVFTWFSLILSNLIWM